MKIPFAAFAAPLAALALAGCTTGSERERGVKVLMIGNSFSLCCMKHLPAVAAGLGVELDLASLYIGGCSLKRHCENAARDGEKDFKPYQFNRSRFGAQSRSEINLCDALRLEKWDVVTVQQASHESWKSESYSPWGDNLVAKIRELAPTAKIFVQETWSYTPWDKRLARWGIDQNVMYEKLHAAYGAFAGRNRLGVVRFGTAVQRWREKLPVKYSENSLGGDVVGGGSQDERDHFKRGADNAWSANCDVFHLNRRGEYFQALVWATALFDADLAELDYKPDFVTDAEARLMKEIAMDVK
ncbi:MAG: DUF4886 domain-containing protein [Kiritimatiellae bacterium]|nr:DUF4886 domain-containing protein [Kiritimatiellia bacterium]